MSAVRTQVYFTREQWRRLDARAARERTTLAQVVRTAAVAYLPADEPDLATLLDEAFGSMPDLEPPRSE